MVLQPTILEPDANVVQERLQLANHLVEAEKFDAAEAIFSQILERAAFIPEVWFWSGLSAYRQRSFRQAATRLKKAVELEPVNAIYHCHYGAALRALGRRHEALASYRAALRLRPEYGDAHNNLGNLLRDMGQPKEAIACYQAALRYNPRSADIYNRLANAYREAGQLDKEIDAYRQALELNPGYAEAHVNMGNAYYWKGDPQKAARCYREALKCGTSYPEAYNNLGNALLLEGRNAEAGKYFAAAIAQKPDYAEAFNNLGGVFQNQGRIAEGGFCFRKALQIKPDYHAARSNLIYALHFDPESDPQRLYAEAGKWWLHHGNIPQTWSRDKTDPDPRRSLRIGYVSPDFREHSVSYFFYPLIRHHDRRGFEIFCYSDVARPDSFTESIRARSDHWRNITWRPDEYVTRMIRADRIDILVDLAGHTSGNRLPVFARKPAPIQVTWLGFPNTTGLPVIDYRLTDRVADPPGTADRLHRETLLRLPNGFLCYQAPQDAPPVAGPPAMANGWITFGSFNNLAKMNPEVVSVWSRLLHAVPRSHLLLKSRPLADPDIREHWLTCFNKAGIDRGRITLLARTESTRDHLALYNRIDIGLDPFPYNGTTTTCEALWMGVPVITLPGDRHSARVGASLLHSVGLDSLVAKNDEDFVRLGIKLASSIDGLHRLRIGLRGQMAESSLCNGVQFADHIETAFRTIWRRWCGGRPSSEGCS